MLGRQWESRLKLWMENLEKRYERPANELELTYFTTFDQLTLEEAKKGHFHEVTPGMLWGDKWEYGWFHTSFVMPEELAGKRVILHLGTSEEMLVFVNDVEAGSIDKQHKYVTITRSAVAGVTYDIYAECYAGHGKRLEDCGPCAIDEITVPEVTGPQNKITKSYLSIWEEEIFQAGMDYLCLYELMKSLPETSLRRMKLIEGLKKFTYIADFELPHDEMVETINEARKVLRPLLECKNGSTAPEFSIFGQSHIDLAWLWPEEETKRKAARTYSNQLKLMEEYPEFLFFMCSPTVLEYDKKYYPALYERIKKANEEGRFIPEGGMWIECDTNVPMGETLIRQFVRGKKWFREEMNADSKLAWMPDTFGFNGQLPQIMKKCQLEFFATQKLLRADPECEQFPYNIFWWEGIDGSRILSHIYKKNNSQFTPAHLIERWEKDRNQEENIDSMIFPFGFGDGGGGCTRTMLEQARRCQDLEGAPRCKYESPVKFFDRIDAENVENTYKGELHLAWHRGTFTVQAETKKGIRKAEVALHDAEYFMSLLLMSDLNDKDELLKSYNERIKKVWDDVLFCTFHDIAPGSSIERVHKEAEEMLAKAKAAAEAVSNEIIILLGYENYIFNTTGLDKDYHGLEIPMLGKATKNTSSQVFEWLDGTHAEPPRIELREIDDCYLIMNNYFELIIDKQGRITNLCRYGDGFEYVAKPWNEFLMFKDINTCYDAWEIGSMYEKLPVELGEVSSISAEIVDDEAIVHVERKLNNSIFRQDIVVGRESERIDFRTWIDWQERHKMLKVSFAGNVHSTEAINDIQFGYMKRPTHRSKQSDKDRYEVTQQKYTCLSDGGHGVAVLNDCKYGVNTVDNDIRLTLLRAPLVPDMNADRGIHEFTYSVYLFEGDFNDSGIENQAYDLNFPVVGSVDSSVSNLVAENGPFSVSNENVIIETMFPTEDGKSLVLRIYESKGSNTTAFLRVNDKVQSAFETDMLLDNAKEMDMSGQEIELDMKPFEIKTILLGF